MVCSHGIAALHQRPQLDDTQVNRHQGVTDAVNDKHQVLHPFLQVQIKLRGQTRHRCFLQGRCVGRGEGDIRRKAEGGTSAAAYWHMTFSVLWGAACRNGGGGGASVVALYTKCSETRFNRLQPNLPCDLIQQKAGFEEPTLTCRPWVRISDLLPTS